jgi:AcrR family transcriptional regulator
MYLYDETHLKRLLLIRRFREEEGLSLAEIKEALDSGRAPVSAKPRTAPPPAASSFSKGAEAANDKGQLIIEKAIQLFSIHGYENVKISDITDAIQIGKGTFYLYFRDKKELLHECFAAIGSLLLASESNISTLKEQDIVVRMKKRWIFFQSQYPHFGGVLQLLQTTAHSDDPAIRKRAIDAIRKVMQPMKEDIMRAQESGLIAQIDPEFLVYAVIGILENITFRLNQDNDYSLAAASDAVEELLKRVLAPLQ